MIVSTKDDIVRLSGSLAKNQWLTIKAAADLLMRSYPQGIVIDCSELTRVSEEGARTFLDAVRDIQAAGARMMVFGLPSDVLKVIRSVPGVRSQLPIAGSLQEARASLKLSSETAGPEANGKAAAPGVLVPLTGSLDIDYAVAIAGKLSRDLHLPVTLHALLEVGRNVPIGAPLPEAEAEANGWLEQAAATASKQGLACVRRMERVRETHEGILQAARQHNATHVVIAVPLDQVREEEMRDLVFTLMERAPCSVIVGRRASVHTDAAATAEAASQRRRPDH
ncbi:MAG TPA: STAS domain-containing protein [Chthonomonadales bacterium]|nr:STAS domain-containing protein [Chthonomonadales bacterium]